MLPRDAPTDVLNEIQLVQDFYGADTPADHQRVMALFAPNAQLDLPQMFVSGRENISAIMFYAKSFIADIDIEPYMVEVATAGVDGHTHNTATATASEAPASSTTSTDSTSSTCTSAATSRRRRPGSGKPPRAPSTGAATAGGVGPSSNGRQRLARTKQQQQQLTSGLSSDVQPRSRTGRLQQHSDQTDQADGTAQNQSAQVSCYCCY